ncbi:T9SS type B sorting domain-containing protein [Inquilinus sp. KBS0705]|nr:T9SS type B sorting domain-containing protein [Inquilinus sp. KBS0705]
MKRIFTHKIQSVLLVIAALLFSVPAFAQVSADATLSDLSLSDGSLSPVFSAGTHNYTATVDHTITTIAVTPTTNDENATVKVNGTTVGSGDASDDITLVYGDNTITVQAKAEDGTTIINYIVHLTRLKATDATLGSLTVTGADVNPDFNGAITSYTATVDPTVASVTLSASVTEENATIKVNNVSLASGATTGNLTLAFGDNTITVKVTAQDGTTIKNYIIHITRLKATDATLSSLVVNGADISPEFDAATTDYTATVDPSVTSVTVTPTVNETNATVKVNNITLASGTTSGNILLAFGANTITVKVTAQDGTTIKNYVIHINRPKSADATLSNLVVNTADLDNEFDAATTNYTASVDPAVSSVTITPTTTNAGATIKVNNVTVASGHASGNIALAFGNNVITVKVTAQDGTTIINYTITVTRPKSADATLSNLVVSGTNISPGFDSGSTDYTATVDAGISSVSITPTAGNANAVIKVNNATVLSGHASGSIALAFGDNLINIKVTAQDGITINNYTVTVTRSLSSDATLGHLVVNGADLSPVFDSGTNTYSASVTNTVSVISITPTVNNSNATVTINGVNVNSGTASDELPLVYGDNTFTVAVTAQDGTTTNSYTIDITRAPSSDATLSNLELSAASLSPSFNAETNAYTASVGNDVTSINVTPTLSDPNATVTVNDAGTSSGSPSGDIALVYGDNLITVTVTASDGSTTNSYSIHVTRQPSSNATLQSLSISDVTLSPDFDGGTTSYSATVDGSISSVVVTPAVTDADATVKVNNVTVAAGESTATIPLAFGNNAITIKVTALDGITVTTYTVHINRVKSTDATLSSLIFSGADLSPDFDPATTTYTSTVDHTVTSITVTPTTTNTNATIRIKGAAVISGTESAAISLVYGDNIIRTRVTAQDGVTLATYITTVTRLKSTDATLSSLTVSGIDLDSPFDPSTNTYTATVDYTATSVTITPTKTDPDATITVNGTTVASGSASSAISLLYGNNTITVIVTAQDGTTTNSYTIGITRPYNTDATLSNLTAAGTDLDPVFDSGTTDYTATVAYGVTTTTITPTLTDANATVAINGNTILSGHASASLPLSLGDNTFNVIVTAQDGTTTNTYTITVTRQPSTDATLSNLLATGLTLSPSFNAATLDYTASVTFGTSLAHIVPTVNDANATVTVNDEAVTSGQSSVDIPLEVGDNAINVAVTAQDGSTVNNYTVTITRGASANARLSNLAVSGATLSPVFATNTLTYAAHVSHETESVTIKPTLANILASVTVNGDAVTSGEASADIPLDIGDNTITVTVTAQNGTTIRNYTVVVTRAKSSDATLSSLALSAADIDPAFDPATTSYAATVDATVSSVTITPTTTDTDATVTVNDASVAAGESSADLSLNIGTNTFYIVVTAANGTTKQTYSLVVTKAPATDATLSSLAIDGADIDPGFDAGTTAYTASVTNDIASVNITQQVTDPNATVKINGSAAPSDGSAVAVPLIIGDNTITISVTAQDGTTINDYTITVTRAQSSDATLSSLTFSSGDLDPAFDPYTNEYNASVGTDISSVNVTPVATDANATVTVNDSTITPGTAPITVPLDFGDNSVTINVTAQDGTPNTYTITVNRPQSSDATLSSLAVSTGELSPAFTPDGLEYTLAVSDTTSAIHITPTANSPSAVITVNDTEVKSGEQSEDIPLDFGDNYINITVTAQDGTPNTYTVTVNRPQSSDATLSSLAVSTGELSPAFTPDGLEYTVAVSDTTSSINITPTANSASAFVTINDNEITSGEQSEDIPLDFGDNNMNITVTAQDGTQNTYTITVNRPQSSDATLNSLAVSTGELSPAFTPDGLEYTVAVSDTTSSINITPTTNSASAFVTINDNEITSGEQSEDIPLDFGDNNMNITVTAQDGTQNTYTITVNRPQSSDATLSSLTLSAGELSPEFESGHKTYTATVANNVSTISFAAIASHSDATISLNGETVTGEGSSGDLDLTVGQNTFTAIVTAPDGETTSTYTVVVTRLAPGNATLSGLTLSSGTLSPAFVKTTANYTATVTDLVSSINVTPFASEVSSTIKVNGKSTKSGVASADIPLVSGNNTITMVVTAKDGTTKTYKVVVTRSAPVVNNANLASLSLTNVSFTPEFGAATTSYTATVPNTVAATSVHFTASDANSKVTVNGKVYTGTSDNIALAIGPNTITTVVTAKDGKTQKTYTVIVSRVKAEQSITFANVTKSFGDADFSPATASSGLAVNYSTSDAKVVSVANGKLHIVGIGTANIAASQPGNTNFREAVTVTRSVTVQIASQTITFTPITKSFGDADFSPATVSSGLPITYVSSAPKVISVLNGKLHVMGIGTATITASQPGIKNQYSAAKPVIQKVTVAIATQSITFAATTKAFGDADFSPATVSSSLPVTYTSSNTNAITVVSGKLHIVGIGVANITASQPGIKDQYLAAKAVTQKVTVTVAAQTITFATTTKAYGDADFSPATVSSGLPITYVSSAPKVVSVVSGKLHIVAPGTSTITASQPGIANKYTAAKSVSQKVTINKGPQVFTFATATHTYGNADFIPATVSTGLPITLISSNPKIVTIVGGKLHIVGTGQANIVISQVGNANYLAANTVTAITINKAVLTVTADNKTKKAGTANPVLTATITGFVNNETKTVLTAQPKLVTPAVIGSKVGTYAITASGATAANYSFTYVAGKLTVTAATVKTIEEQPLNQPFTQVLPPPVVSKAMSPNGDGINDVLTIEGIDNYPDNRLMIMDINGSSLFEIQGYDNQAKVFDGHASTTQAMQKPGTYYYLLEYKDKGELKRVTGYFLLKY